MSTEYKLEHQDELYLEQTLKTVQLPESVLEHLVNRVKLTTILTTQKLSLDFIIRYFMDSKYHKEDTESTISYAQIEYYQGYTKEQIEKRMAIL